MPIKKTGPLFLPPKKTGTFIVAQKGYYVNIFIYFLNKSISRCKNHETQHPKAHPFQFFRQYGPMLWHLNANLRL